jgi:hypothetical protein
MFERISAKDLISALLSRAHVREDFCKGPDFLVSFNQSAGPVFTILYSFWWERGSKNYCRVDPTKSRYIAAGKFKPQFSKNRLLEATFPKR